MSHKHVTIARKFNSFEPYRVIFYTFVFIYKSIIWVDIHTSRINDSPNPKWRIWTCELIKLWPLR